MSAWEWVGIIVYTAIASTWGSIGNSGSSLAMIAFHLSFAFSAVICGKIVTELLPRGILRTPGFAANFLFGYFVINTAVYLGIFIFPVPPEVIFYIIIILPLVVFFLRGEKFTFKWDNKQERILPVVAFLLTMLAASIWCRECIAGIIARPDYLLVKPWNDCFQHAAFIRNMRNYYQAGILQSLQMGGIKAGFYHYAPYALPTVLARMTGASTLIIFTNFMLPFGYLLTGLTGFVFIKNMWGNTAGICGLFAAMLLPDAAMQGFGNPWFSFHWLVQASAGLLYGTALLTLSWLFMLAACRKRNFIAMGICFGLAALLIVYKAQLFLASAFLLWLLPPLFMRKLSVKIRIVWFVPAAAIYFTAVAVSQTMKKMPVMGFDFSWYKSYVQFVISSFNSQALQKFFYSFVTPKSTLSCDLLTGISLVLFCTFGLMLFAYIILVMILRRRIRLLYSLFPALIILNYLAMSLFAPNLKGVGCAYELIQRPFVWAYFMVTVWCGGAVGYIFRKRLSRKHFYTGIFAAAIILSVAVLFFSGNVRHGPPWQKNRTDDKIPIGLYNACLFVRDNSPVTAFVQDSQNDPKLAVAALTERQIYASKMHLGTYLNTPPGLKKRIIQLEMFKQFDLPADIIKFMNYFKVKWYIMRPGEKTAWPKAILDHPAYESHGYKVFYLK